MKGRDRAPSLRALRRRWIVAQRIARRSILRQPSRYSVAIAIFVIPIVAILAVVTVWSTNASRAALITDWLGSDSEVQAVALRIAESPVHQDEAGTVDAIDTRTEVEAEDVPALLDSWIPEGDRLLLVEKIDVVHLMKTGTAEETSVVNAFQTDSLSAPGLPEGLDGIDLKPGSALISEDLAGELGLRVGDEISVSTGSNGDASLLRTAEVRVQDVVEGSRVFIMGAGSLELATYEVGEGSTTSFYIAGPEPVTWELIDDLNESGFLVMSRQVLSEMALKQGVEWNIGWEFFVLLIGGILILIELVLLVEPIFAVSQNRATRTAAIVFAIGGDHHDQGRLIMAVGWWVGLISSLSSMLLLGVFHLVYAYMIGVNPLLLPRAPLLLALCMPMILGIAAAIPSARDLASVDSVAVLRGSARTPSRLVRRTPVYPLALLSAVPAMLGAAATGSLLLLALGIALFEAGLIGSIPYAISKRWRRSDGASLSVRLALRDAIRNGSRTLPAMGSLMTTSFIAAALLITLTSANEAAWNSQAHLGPRGSVLVSDSDPSVPPWEARRTQEAAARAVDELRGVKQSVEVNGMPWGSTTAGPALIVEATSPSGGAPLSIAEDGRALGELDLAYLVDDGSFLKASGLVSGDEMVKAIATLKQGGAILPDASYIDAQGGANLRALDMTASLVAESNGEPEIPDPTIVSEQRIPASSWSELNIIVLSPEAADRLSLPAKPLGRLLILDRPVGALAASAFETSMVKEVPGSIARVVRETTVNLLLPRLAALVSLLAAAGTIALVVVLAANDMRPDFETLEAMGASRDLRRRVSAYQGIGIAFVCIPVAVLSGLFVGVLSVVAIAESGRFSTLVGLSPVIPVVEIVGLLVGAPLIAMLVARAASPKGAVKPSRIP